jgi:hypothetical protein
MKNSVIGTVSTLKITGAAVKQNVTGIISTSPVTGIISIPNVLPGYDSDLLTYINGIVTPLSDNQLTLLNNFIVGIKLDLGIENLSDFFDFIYILAGETEETSRRNLVSRNYDLTLSNSPTFTQFEGYYANGTQYLLTNYIPSVHGVNYTRYNGAIGVYNRSVPLNEIRYSMGSVVLPYSLIRMNGYTSFRGAVNTGSMATKTFTGNPEGIYSAIRYADGDQIVCKNAIAYNSPYVTTGVSAIGLRLLGCATSSPYIGQQSFAYISKSLTLTQLGYLINRIEAYMDAHGKGVIE